MPKKTDKTPTPDASEWDKGYRGETPDETPNAAYTVDGVTSGASTPETSDSASDGESPEDK